MALKFTIQVYQRLNIISFWAGYKDREKPEICNACEILNALRGAADAHEDIIIGAIKTTIASGGIATISEYEYRMFSILKDIYESLESDFNKILIEDCEDVESSRKGGVVLLSRELYVKIKRQSKLSNDEILCRGRGLFSSVYQMCIFFQHFTDIYQNYSLVKNMAQMPFLENALNELMLVVSMMPREIHDDLKSAISKLNACLRKIENPDSPPDSEVLMDIISYSGELNTELNTLCRRYKIPRANERPRWAKISRTMTARRAAVTNAMKNVCKEIKNKARSHRNSVKAECEKYFQENVALLSEYGIHSPRTLENRCSGTNPNKARKERRHLNAALPIPIEFWDKMEHALSPNFTSD